MENGGPGCPDTAGEGDHLVGESSLDIDEEADLRIDGHRAEFRCAFERAGGRRLRLVLFVGEVGAKDVEREDRCHGDHRDDTEAVSHHVGCRDHARRPLGESEHEGRCHRP